MTKFKQQVNILIENIPNILTERKIENSQMTRHKILRHIIIMKLFHHKNILYTVDVQYITYYFKLCL